MSTIVLLELSVALFMAGALVSLLLARDRKTSGWASVVFVAAAAAALWAVVARTFAMGADAEVSLTALTGIGATLAVKVDTLSALFLAIVATIAFLTTLYSVEYMTHYKRDSVAKFYPVLLVFFAGIVGVVATADFLFFLVFWELMTLASFFLVIFEHENRSSQRAGLKYFVITHAATFCMVAAALILWAKSGSFHFSAMRAALGGLLVEQPFLAHLAIFLFFIGFATKAGILPMGDWLPDAYPAAPSGATAAFGGSMTKLGIYGLLRVFLYFVPLSDATQIWGVVIALAGTASLFLGTLTALRQDDSKRLMSFHVIGQVGYMFLGIGIGLYFLPNESTRFLGMLGLLGGVFHMVNHSMYKSCLFLGAGSILYRTGTRSLNAMGGLGPLMPVTAMCATGAALAISGVPPLNGFASKWLMYATSILGGQKFALFVVMGLVAMFISLVTLASFLKYLGGAFLGPQTTRQGVREVPASMLIPQIVLALGCLGFGLVPLLPLHYVYQGLAGLMPDAHLPALGALLGTGQGLAFSLGGTAVGFWAPLPVALGLVVLGLIAYWVQRAGGAEIRHVPVWYCGEEHAPELVRYPAASFYAPFKHAFENIYPSVRLRVPRFPAALRTAFDIDTWLYGPFVRLGHRVASGVSKSHVGIPQMYLLWIVLGAIVVVGIVIGIAR
jgi:hydrogenase-4 component B